MAVFTTLSQSDITNFLKSYQIEPPFDYRGIAAGVQNTTYILSQGNKKWVLTLYESGESLDYIQFISRYMTFLKKHNICCPEIYCDKDGNQIQQFKNKYAVLVEYINGQEIAYPKTPRLEQIEPAAIMLGEMHRAALNFQEDWPNSFSVESYFKDWYEMKDTSHTLVQKYAEPISQIIADLKNHEQNSNGLPKTVLHLDLFPDNFLYDGNKLLGVIDFNLSYTDYLLYDFCIFYNAWAFDENHQFDPQRHKIIFENYSKHRKFEDNEKEQLPYFMRIAALRFLLFRMKTIIFPPEASDFHPKDPLEYFEKLNFHLKQKTYNDYL